jgi:hypothetical protein
VSYSLSLRPRALAEIAAARENYALVGHGNTFLAELEAMIEAIQAMPFRFPIIYWRGPSGAAAALSIRCILSSAAGHLSHRGAGRAAAARRSCEVATTLS